VSNVRPIGVFDSGVGGLTVAAAIQDQLPNERIIYFGDSARCPYGNRAPDEVVQYSAEVCDFLFARDVKMIVVACNTATAVALPYLVARYDVPVIGVIQPGAKAATQVAGVRRIGVIGTAVTIASGAYEAAIRARLPSVSVYSVACPTFVPLVESGRLSGPDVLSAVWDGLEPMIQYGVDTLILGCTHYPLLQPVISEVMGDRVTVISSAEETAFAVLRQLDASGEAAVAPDIKGPRHTYFTSGDTSRLRFVLQSWFHLSGDAIDVSTLDLTNV